MLAQSAIQTTEECPTCCGRGFIRVEKAECYFPKTEAYSTVRLTEAFILGLLILSPTLLGLYWEVLFSG